MNRRLFKILVFITVACMIAGCKLAVMVVEGGEVTSSGLGPCAEGTICVYEINDHTFNQSFTAAPNAGWKFVRWNKGGGFFCADSTNPTCVVTNVGTSGIPAIEAIVNSGAAFYIMPIFEKVGLPITDIVTVGGKEWAQADLFGNLSWNDIAAVCPAGICVENGKLNGHIMTGWTWASVDDVNGLFNIYIGSSVMGPGPDDYSEWNSAWGPAFFTVWQPLTPPGSSNLVIGGFTATESSATTAYSAALGVSTSFPDFASTDNSRLGIDDDLKTAKVGGAWFWR